MNERGCQRPRLDPDTDREAGIVLVWFALLLFGLVAITALCVDIGSLVRARRAMCRRRPTPPRSRARCTCRASPTTPQPRHEERDPKQLHQRGEQSGTCTVLAAQSRASPTSSRWTISKTFPGVFGSVLGFGQPADHPLRDRRVRDGGGHGQSRQHLRQRAHRRPTITTHDRGPTFRASHPTCGATSSAIRPRSGSGDAQQAVLCQSGNDGCSGTSRTPTTPTRATSTGSRSTTPQRPSGAKLAIQVFDPGRGRRGRPLRPERSRRRDRGAPPRTRGPPRTAPSRPTRPTRYDWGDTSATATGVTGAGKFCTGDNHDYAPTMPVTIYVVRANTTPNDPTAAPVVNQGTCAGLQIPGFDKTLSGGTLNQGECRLRRAAGERVPPVGARVHVRPLDGARRSTTCCRSAPTSPLGGSAAGPGSAPRTRAAPTASRSAPRG